MNNKGSLLLITVLILASMLTISLGVASIITSGLVQGRTQANSTKAYFAAESGAEQVLWEIRKNFFEPDLVCSTTLGAIYVQFPTAGSPTSTCVNTVQNYSLTNGSSYSILFSSSSPYVIMNINGIFQNLRRTVQIFY